MVSAIESIDTGRLTRRVNSITAPQLVLVGIALSAAVLAIPLQGERSVLVAIAGVSGIMTVFATMLAGSAPSTTAASERARQTLITGLQDDLYLATDGWYVPADGAVRFWIPSTETTDTVPDGLLTGTLHRGHAAGLTVPPVGAAVVDATDGALPTTDSTEDAVSTALSVCSQLGLLTEWTFVEQVDAPGAVHVSVAAPHSDVQPVAAQGTDTLLQSVVGTVVAKTRETAVRVRLDDTSIGVQIAVETRSSDGKDAKETR